MVVVTRSRRPEEREPAPVDPVARVCVDVPLAHLDRPFDYLVPTTMDDAVVAGSRVRVRFAGQLVDGVVLERIAESEYPGTLEWINRATSAEPVLAPEIARLARAVADRWAGALSDVLRLAIPPRHARVEAQAPAGEPAKAPPPPDPGPPGGEAVWLAWTRPRIPPETGRGPVSAGHNLMSGFRNYFGDVHVMSAVSRRGVLHFQAVLGPFDAALVADFLRRLTTQTGRELDVVVGKWPAQGRDILRSVSEGIPARFTPPPG